jgi:hypothetical protein
MKHLIFYLFIALSFGFYSCEKCGTCTTTSVTDVSPPMSGFPQTQTTTQTNVCGDDFEKLDGSVVTSDSKQGDITVTTTSTTRCIKD